MGAKFINIDRATPMMFPPDLRDWIPANSMVHFIVDAVEQFDMSSFKVNERGSGSAQYPPKMLLALLIYNYATGRFSSREIEQATHIDVAVRYICGGDTHPDHDTICSFRRNNEKAFREVFVKVLMVAQELGHLKKVGGISVDGTKIKANASKHSAVSFKRAGEMIEQLELEIEALAKKAEEADNAPLQDGLTIPEEIMRREDRKAALEKAAAVIQERYKSIREEKQREYEARKKERDEQRKNGRKPKGKDPKPPPETPPDDNQYNFTDPESRIMKAGNSNHFEQCYNAQASVDIEGSMLITGAYVTDNCNDKLELKKSVQNVDKDVLRVSEVCADTGYFSEKAVLAVEAANGPVVYCAVEKQSHHRTVDDLLKKPVPTPPPDNASIKEKMIYRLKTEYGKARYKLRKETVEPVFGIIKSVLGFRQFSMRGLGKASLEWDIVTTAYNFKRLHKLCNGQLVSEILNFQRQNA